MIRLSEGREFRYSVITRNKARGSFLNEADDRGEDSVSINAVRCNSGSSSAIPTSGALSFSHESDPSSLSPNLYSANKSSSNAGGPGGFGTQFFH